MSFVPRLSPNTPTPMQGNPWWYSSGNWFYPNGYGLPNCTCYAYGRYAEVRNAFANLPLSNAGKWWNDVDRTVFRTGSVPALGAVACWATSDPTLSAPGHVAIVEEIHSDGSITISESGWQAWYFNLEVLSRESGYLSSWMQKFSRKYYLQGFIYNDAEPSTEWEAKATGGYAKTSQEAYNNAYIIYAVLSNYGWTVNAVCGLLGNIDIESGYNPWRWQTDTVPAHNDSVITTGGRAYGLVQWDPASKYIGDSMFINQPSYAPNFSDRAGNSNDGYAQLYALENMPGQYSPAPGYPMTFAEYKASTDTAANLAAVWCYNYERPGTPHEQDRRDAAEYWYNLFSGVTPPTPTPTPPVKPRKMPLWFYMKNRRRFF